MKITVTAGHGTPLVGRHDPGATWPHGAPHPEYTEAELMADLRNYVAARLRERGHEVRTDGDGRLNRALAAAVALIPGTDLAIELHTNSFPNPAATGVEVVAPASRKEVAQRIAQAIARVLGIPVRGQGGWIDKSQTARGDAWFVRDGGLIVETFFLSNDRDRNAYLARKHDVAAAIAEAVTA